MAGRERGASHQGGPLRGTTGRAVLETLAAEEGTLTRAELARRTGISPPAISEAVRRLEADELVVAVGPRSGYPGAVATLYAIAPGAGVVVAVEVTPTTIRTAVGDLAGRVLEQAAHAPAEEISAVAARLDAVLAEVGERFRAVGRPLRAVAVSVSHPVDGTSGGAVGLLESAFPAGVAGVAGTHGVDPDTVVLDTDVHFAALAEKDHGIAADAGTFAYLAVDERHGVGLGLVVDGHLVRGARGLAGAIGYLPLGEGTGRFRLGRSVAAQGFRTDPPGDAPAADLPAAGRLLGEAATAVCALVDPDLVVLGGSAGADPELVDRVGATVAELAPREVPVVAGALGDAAPLGGALAEARQRAWHGLRSRR